MVSPKFFQNFFKKNLRPIPRDDAQIWRDRLSKLYLFLGFNIMGLIAYYSFRDDLELIPKDKDYKKAQRFGKLAYGDTIHVIEYRGLQKKNEYMIKKDDL